MRCFEVDSPQVDIHLPRRVLRQIQKQDNVALLSRFVCTVPPFCHDAFRCCFHSHTFRDNVCTHDMVVEDFVVEEEDSVEVVGLIRTYT